MLRLHYMPWRTSLAPHAALAEAQATYTLHLVEEDESGRRPAEYLALNPWGQVPTLEDGDLVLTESAAIMLHLADRFPGSGLGAPIGTRARSELYRWLGYLSSAVQQTYMRWYYPERYTSEPAGEAAIRAVAETELHRHIDWIDGELAGRPWLIGDERTGADLYLFMMTCWGDELDPPMWDSPNVAAHFARMRKRPGVQRTIAEEGLELP